MEFVFNSIEKVKPVFLPFSMCIFFESNGTKSYFHSFHLQNSRILQTRMGQRGNPMKMNFDFFFFFSICVFFHEHSRFTGQQGKGEDIFLTPLYHFCSLHIHLDISQAITAESSPLHIVAAGLEPGTFGFRAQVAKGKMSFLNS